MLTALQNTWLTHLLCTDPSDRPRAESALRSLYPDVLERQPPTHIFWLNAPERAGWAVILLANEPHSDRSFIEEKERTPEGRQFLKDLRTELCDQSKLKWTQLTKIAGMPRIQQVLWHPYRVALHGLAHIPVQATLKTHPLHSEFKAKVSPLRAGPDERDPVRQVEDRFRAAILSRTGRRLSLGYNHSGAYTYAKMAQDEAEANSSGREVPPAIAAAWDLARNAGECWVLEGAAVFLERPAQVRLNPEMLLHCDDGPAVLFRDGTPVWVWNGTITDEEAILHSNHIPAAKWAQQKRTLPPEFVTRIEARRTAESPKPSDTPKRPTYVTRGDNFLARYQAGEHEAVWKDLMSLGPDVREAKYESDARAIANETMRRAQHNFELIRSRLMGLGYKYKFPNGSLKQSPLWEIAMGDVSTVMSACEEAGLLIPISLQAFMLGEICAVTLLGTHPALCPKGNAAIADPAAFSPNPEFEAKLDEWETHEPDDLVPDLLVVGFCASPLAKAQLMDGGLGEDYYGMQLPDASVDAALTSEPEGRTLVEYLRWTFQWGGFPGWEKERKRPEKELFMLKEGLLPL